MFIFSLVTLFSKSANFKQCVETFLFYFLFILKS